jgi:cell division septal protein FtsQ
MKLIERLKQIFTPKKKNRFSAPGVETGRVTFRFDEREKRQHRTLLKKLNHYWTAGGSHRSQPYHAEKKSTILRKVLLVCCLLSALVLFQQKGGIGLFSILLQDIDYFRLTAVEIEGCRNSTPDEIRKASGITISSSMFSVDEELVSRKVKMQSLWIDRVSVTRRWPDTVVLKVEEYEPYALIAVGDSAAAALYYLDRHGNRFIKTDYGMDLDYPVITGLEHETDPVRMAQHLRAPLDLLKLVGSNNPNLPIQSISEVHVGDEDGMILYLVEHPFPIFFGDGEIRQKYYRLRKVLEMLYKPKKTGMDIGGVAYIKMDYLQDKVIVGYSES